MYEFNRTQSIILSRSGALNSRELKQCIMPSEGVVATDSCDKQGREVIAHILR